MKAALYLRVSTDQQTTENQRLALERATEYKGWEVVQTFADHGISGTTTKREALQTALQAAERGEFDVLMCTELNRISRSTIDLANLSASLERSKVQLFSLNPEIDTSTPAGRLFFTLIGALGQFERELLVERTKMGLARARKEGKTPGKPPIPLEKRLLIYERLTAPGCPSARTLAEIYGVSRPMIFKLKNEINDGTAQQYLVSNETSHSSRIETN